MKKSFNKMSCLMASALVLSAPVVSAEDSPHEFSANVALSTDYLFRGISQTDGGPAISGGFDYTYTPWGFYAGTWASSIDFADTSPVEIDYYGGFAGEFSGGIAWDIGAIYYDYPQGDDTALGADLEYIEAYGSLEYTFEGSWEPTVGVFVAYSPDFFGETDDAVAVEGSLGLALPVWGLSLSSTVGYQDVDDIGEYEYWSVGLSKDLSIFTFDVTYSGTGDTDDDFCAGGLDLCDDTVVFSVSSSW